MRGKGAKKKGWTTYIIMSTIKKKKRMNERINVVFPEPRSIDGVLFSQRQWTQYTVMLNFSLTFRNPLVLVVFIFPSRKALEMFQRRAVGNHNQGVVMECAIHSMSLQQKLDAFPPFSVPFTLGQVQHPLTSDSQHPLTKQPLGLVFSSTGLVVPSKAWPSYCL